MFEKISVIGCGRWGGFLAYYFAKYKKSDVLIYGRESCDQYQSLINNGENSYLKMPENVSYTTDMETALKNDFVVISIGCQGLRDLAKELNKFDLTNKIFLLAMKGLEESTGKRLTQVFEEETKSQQNVSVSVLLGPGHVQDYLQSVPSCAVIDSSNQQAKIQITDYVNSELIRAYYGTDLIGNEVGAALKNVIGLAAGILDGLNWKGLKGALLARAPMEVAKIIKYYGGNPMTAYGLSHLGDYEATLFSKHSNNRTYGEMFAIGKPFEKLAEGLATLKSVYNLRDKIDLPICTALYQVLFEGKDIRDMIDKLFTRPIKSEF